MCTGSASVESPHTNVSSSLVVLIITVSVTWKGSVINGPKLIYHDEMNDNPLFCVSSSQSQVGWHYASGLLVSTFSMTNHYRQERTSTGKIPSKAKLIAIRPNDPLTSTAGNGLWSCRLNGGFNGAVPVGIYARGGGKVFLCAYMQWLICDFQRVGFKIVKQSHTIWCLCVSKIIMIIKPIAPQPPCSSIYVQKSP